MLLNCAEKYCTEINNLVDGLKENKLHSEGLNSFAEYLLDYIESDTFKEFYSHVIRLRNQLSTVEYCMYIKNGTIRVRKYEGEIDYSQKLLKCFEKFRQGEVKDYHKKLDEEPIATHVEAEVLNMVASLYKDIFTDLNIFCEKYMYFIDNTISRFACEIQFYLSWLEYILPLRQVGLPFNYPKLVDNAEHIYVREGFDLALAFITRENTVTNDFILNTPERIIVVTGPNQGGKTTFARAFGQMHWLASLGLCIPGSEATLNIFDNIFTHFAREEDLSSLNGKLQDDLIRLHDLLKKATNRSIIIVNEIFSSTTLSDALVLGQYMMDAISKIGAIAVVVTFLDKLAYHGEETVSMVSIVNESDPTERTYKIIRKPPDGLAYAMHIANEYNLTYEQICRRLKK
ncbi:MutS-related protein [Thermobrachium celere]|uniref:MutS-related protein n=1 Tax=Thermobrachium celere TaxID=53422 RepID=UPI0019436F09|nr:DNA mismatch repair protein MutS [Thermobrachium celere]GFR35685.1 DNA mismatch repair protein MutS [Thermobrachium celere]